MSPLGFLTLASIAVAIAVVVVSGRRRAYADEDAPNPPIFVGSILAGSSAAAFVSLIHYLWVLISFYLVQIGWINSDVRAPRLPLDIQIILAAGVLWMSYETGRHVLHWLQVVEKPKTVISRYDEERVYALANRELDAQLDEVKKAIARDGGYTTAQLLEEARAATMQPVNGK